MPSGCFWNQKKYFLFECDIYKWTTRSRIYHRRKYWTSRVINPNVSKPNVSSYFQSWKHQMKGPSHTFGALFWRRFCWIWYLDLSSMSCQFCLISIQVLSSPFPHFGGVESHICNENTNHGCTLLLQNAVMRDQTDILMLSSCVL